MSQEAELKNFVWSGWMNAYGRTKIQAEAKGLVYAIGKRSGHLLT